MYDDSFRSRYGTAPIAFHKTNSCSDTVPHIHNEIELLYIKKGKSKIKIGSTVLTAKTGDVFFINPLEVHSITVPENQEYLHYCICFDTNLIADNSIKEYLLNGEYSVVSQISNNSTLIDLFKNLYTCAKQQTDTLVFECNSIISNIFIFLIKNNMINKTKISGKDTLFTKKVLQYLAQNFSRSISSKTAAIKLFYTQSYFCRNFKKIFGVPFSQYVTFYRISQAKILLLTTNKSVSELTELCGFESATYFTRCFKKYTTFTPLQYRKNQYSTKI